MSEPSPSSHEPTSPAPVATGWQRLPLRGALLHGAMTALALLVVGAVVGTGARLGGRFEPTGWMLAAGVVVLALLLGSWAFVRRRRVRWQLDAQGLGVRRGRLWQHETRVPASRVQHLDLRRGPIERMIGLATLVVHTAGSRFSAVAIEGLAMSDAERLRDRLARQLDADDDAL